MVPDKKTGKTARCQTVPGAVDALFQGAVIKAGSGFHPDIVKGRIFIARNPSRSPRPGAMVSARVPGDLAEPLVFFARQLFRSLPKDSVLPQIAVVLLLAGNVSSFLSSLFLQGGWNWPEIYPVLILRPLDLYTGFCNAAGKNSGR